MQHKRLRPEFLNQIAAYIDATDADLDALRRTVQPVAFGDLATHVWSHIPCLKRRLAVLTARDDEQVDDRED
jgi:hypothetical protein